MSYVVDVRGLTKAYGDMKAVDGVTFQMEAGKIYGLLGRNGAGKTTIMHMLTAQLFATSGELSVFGEHPYENSRVLEQMCFIKESQKYPDTFRVIDVLEVSASLYPHWDRDFAHSLVEEFNLPLKRRMKKLSRGMLSSVGIIVGLASRAPLTIFDEPYLGLDAVARTLFYDRLLEDYALHPRTVVLSTHLIDEVSKLLEHVMLLHRGKLLLNEDTEQLRGRAFTVAGSAEQVAMFLEGKDILHRETLGGLVTATVLSRNGGELVDRKHAQALGLELGPVTLQQLVVNLTQRADSRKEAIAR
ncbi:multidrug ABC transporter ATPase [Paenibacillus swuensis]|uniref:Multidrug ABC transporter ATPase n=1 Tax=Paenibacillus swuensis TaxID=1178515 RepID=A0A172THN2_9BACL|nr:ABC transporter ATP-binding protein [Paenibacillus swuensis]ANE46472.1 multidrug ABC transporter ATPase [Paenibacillus swuensis]